MLEKELLRLLHDMSIEEKIGQLLQLDGNLFYDDISFETGPASQMGFTTQNKRLCGSLINMSGANRANEVQANYMEHHPHHIPLLFMLDVINGYQTVFPIPLAQGCTFSPEAVYNIASITAAEASTDGVHVTFSPMSDLVSDSRWGRVMESTGEDPYLNSVMTAAAIKGYQGEHLEEKKIASCMKHFAGYGSPIAGREYNTVELSERSLFEDYLPAYRSGVDAGCKLVMTSFNTLGRIPSTANKYLLQTVLRQAFSFEGVIISDYNSIGELINHGIASDPSDAARLAFRAGVDIEMCSNCYGKELPSLILQSEDSDFTEEHLDAAVLRILKLKNELGLFEAPFKDSNEIAHNTITLSTHHRKMAFDACVQSFVLLKNKDCLLPLSTNDSVAYIGPYTDNRSIHGAWSHQANENDTISIKDGVLKYHKSAQFEKGSCLLDKGTEIYAFGNEILSSDYEETEQESHIKSALELARQVHTVVLCLGEHRLQTGEGGSRVNPVLPMCQIELLKQVYAVNPNIVLILFAGRPLILTEIEPYCKSILTVWFPGTEGGNAIASVLYGESEPSGKLSITFPREVGQLPMTYREFHTGRPYIEFSPKTRFVSRYQDCPNSPLYPFGYGLGYSDYSCSEITLDRKTLNKDDTLHASVTITNVGHRRSRQVVQLYLQDPVASVCRLKRELKGFKEVILNPQDSKSITFPITESMLRFYDIAMNYKSEFGTFILYIGFDSTTENCCEFEYR